MPHRGVGHATPCREAAGMWVTHARTGSRRYVGYPRQAGGVVPHAMPRSRRYVGNPRQAGDKPRPYRCAFVGILRVVPWDFCGSKHVMPHRGVLVCPVGALFPHA